MNGDVTVRMCPGWAVFLDDRLFASGDTIELDPRTAAHWCRRGWAERAKPTSTVSRPGVAVTTSAEGSEE